jgi:hypothetical protein
MLLQHTVWEVDVLVMSQASDTLKQTHQVSKYPRIGRENVLETPPRFVTEIVN